MRDNTEQTSDKRRQRRLTFSSNVIDMLEISDELAALCRYGEVVEINSAGQRLLGARDAQEVLGSQFIGRIAGDYVPVIGEMISIRLIEITRVPALLHRADQTMVEVTLLVHPARELGDGFALVTARDISREGKLAKTAEVSETRFRALVDKSMHLICECLNGTITYINAAGAAMLGSALPALFCGQPVANIFHGDYRRVFEEDLSALLAERDIFTAQLARLDGSALSAQIKVSALNQDRNRCSFMLQARDITAHNRAVAALRLMNETLEKQVADRTEELRRLATTDVLTGLPNRRHFMEMAEQEIERARRYKRPLTALMLDIDHFKRINDSWGHHRGDAAIRAVAASCKSILRSEDAMGRLGGEEFAILMPETRLEGALLVAERLRQAISEIRIEADDTVIGFTISIGAALYSENDSGMDALLSRADAALYRAKNTGRNRVVAA